MEAQISESDSCELNEKLWAEKFVSKDCYPKVLTNIIKPISKTVGCPSEYLYSSANATSTNFARAAIIEISETHREVANQVYTNCGPKVSRVLLNCGRYVKLDIPQGTGKSTAYGIFQNIVREAQDIEEREVIICRLD